MLRPFPVFSPLAYFCLPLILCAFQLDLCAWLHIFLCVYITLLRNLRKLCLLYDPAVCAAGVNAGRSRHQNRKLCEFVGNRPTQTLVASLGLVVWRIS